MPSAARSPRSFARIGIPRASSASPGPEASPNLPVAILAWLLPAVAFCPTVLADEVHLAGGRVVRATDCRRADGELRCRIGSGTVGFPLDQVVGVDKSRHEDPRRRPSPRPSEPVEVALPEQPETGALTPDAARSRIERLSAGPGASGGPAPAAQVELGFLHAYLGNVATTSGDFEAAREQYEQALRHDPTLRIARLNLATVLINMDHHLQADELIRDALVRNPDDPRALYLQGESRYQTGRLPEAIESWERSLALEPSERVEDRLAQARRLGQAERGFLRSDGAHFSLKFDGEAASPALAEEILAYLEESYTELTNRFYHSPRGVIQVTLYSRESFHEATESPDWVGGLYDGQIRIPVGGLSSLTPRARRVLIHELTHCFVASKTHGNVPQWLQEGIAQLAEGKKSSPRTLSGLSELYKTVGTPSFGAEFSYPKSLSQLEFFLDTWSESHLNDLLDHLARGTDIDGAMVSVTGLSYGDFLRGWADGLGR